MVASWLQITVISLWALILGFDIARHGERKTGEHNAIYTSIGIIISAALYYLGGFFG